MKNYQVLVINPGAVSTKLALFDSEDEVWSESIYHPESELEQFVSVPDQQDYRTEAITSAAEDRGIEWDSLSAVSARGGLMKPVAGGTYEVNEQMLADLEAGYQGEHASNLGGIIAAKVARDLGIRAYVVDPVATDEMSDVARFSGLKGITRRSLAHTLNIKAVCRDVFSAPGSSYSEVNAVVAHLGSGVSVTAHSRGRMVDVNNANEEGPFSTERTGGLPVLQLVDLVARRIAAGETGRSVGKMLRSRGGLSSYLGTRDLKRVEQQIDRGDEEAARVLRALAYQVSKEIGAMCASLCGHVDGIILTGGMARSERLVGLITRRVERLGPVTILPGEREMEALALGALRVLRGEEEPRIYR